MRRRVDEQPAEQVDGRNRQLHLDVAPQAGGAVVVYSEVIIHAWSGEELDVALLRSMDCIRGMNAPKFASGCERIRTSSAVSSAPVAGDTQPVSQLCVQLPHSLMHTSKPSAARPQKASRSLKTPLLALIYQ